MPRDPVVAEVRAIRERLFAECDHDLSKVVERDRELQRSWPGRIVTKADLDGEGEAARSEER